MSNIFKPKRSNTASSVPTTGQLADGELAVNTVDKKIFVRDGASVVEVANFSTGGSGTNYWVQTAAGIHTLSSVGIGTTNPVATLEVRPVSTSINVGLFTGSTTTDLVRITQDGVGNALRVDDQAGGTTPFIVDNAGRVGINTITATSSLTVFGDSRITGIVTATSFSGSGVNLTGIVTQIVAGTNVTINPVGGTGAVTINSTASGSGGGIQIRDDGNIIGTGVTTINFAGSGISTTTVSSGIATVTIPGAWTTIKKLSDQSVSATTALTNDNALTFTMAANAEYVIRIHVWYNTAANADFKYGFNGSAAATRIRMHRVAQIAGATAFTVSLIATAYDTTGVALAGAGTDGYITLHGIIRNGAAASTFNFSWAQNTSQGTNTTVYSGSYLEYAVV